MARSTDCITHLIFMRLCCKFTRLHYQLMLRRRTNSSVQHKPFGDIHFQQDQMLIFTEDGTVPPSYEIAELNHLLAAVRATRLQQQVALSVAIAERDGGYLSKNEIQKATNDIIGLEGAIKHQDAKEQFLLSELKECAQTNEQCCHYH